MSERAARVGRLAAEALRVEAWLTPKPGLVDAVSVGAHRDMDLDLLLTSADALEPAFIEMAQLGQRPGWSVADLQNLGRRAELVMSAATGGVNTHKGAIFCLGWLSAVAAETSAPDIEGICLRVGRIVTQLLQEWRAVVPATGLTHGEQVFVTTGLTGARGEAASGFASVRTHALPAMRQALQRGWTKDEALLAALLQLMAISDDTNLITRGGIDALRSVRAWAAQLGASDPDPSALISALAQADDWFIANWWSPGGSADLLAVTWFLKESSDRR